MSALVCPSCGARRAIAEPEHRCACGELLELAWTGPAPDRGELDRRRGAPRLPARSGVWRFRELVHPELAEPDQLSLGEGNTPLLESPALARFAGLERAWFKHEGLNPTGSFKDRGMAVAVSQARASGARRLACASTGNTAASLAAYAALAGLPAVVIAPEKGTALGKLSQALAHGARTLLVRGDFDRALALVRASAADLGLRLLNSVDPFRLEGQKTIVLEVLQDLGWEPPDWIAFPAGNLGNCAAFGKALREARAAGLIERAPRLLAVQAEGANPFARSFRAGFARLEPLRADTIASAIRIGDPASFARAVRSIRETNGAVTDVPDAAILAAKAAVDRAGIGCEPASAAALAGVARAVREGAIRPEERVVCVLTGHVLKDPDATIAHHAPGSLAIGANPPRVIDASADALRHALSD